MLFSDRLANRFGPEVRKRGANYFFRGVVHIDDLTKTMVEATVWGSADYYVTLRFLDNTLIVSCNCPYSSDHGLCKHIWATMLAAEKRAFLADLEPSVQMDLEVDEGDLDDEAFENEDNYEDLPPTHKISAATSGSWLRETTGSAKAKPAPVTAWKSKLHSLVQSLNFNHPRSEGVWPTKREIGYIVDVEQSLQTGGLCIEIASREPKQNGEWSKFRAHRIPLSQILALPEAADREILAALAGAGDPLDWSSTMTSTLPRFKLKDPHLGLLFPRICATGRCRIRRSRDEIELALLHWDDGPAWQFWVSMDRMTAGNHFSLNGLLQREDKQIPLSEPDLLIGGGLVFLHGNVARLDDGNAFLWITQLRQTGDLQVPVDHGHELIETLLQLPRLPRLKWPEEFHIEEAPCLPVPCLKVRKATRYESFTDRLRAQLFFNYDGIVIPYNQVGRGVWNKSQERFLLRDMAAEQAAVLQLADLGLRYTYSPPYGYSQTRTEWELQPAKLPRTVRALVAAGWRVEAEGKLYRMPGAIRIEVRSGIDWFELHGTVQYGDVEAALPALLASLNRREQMVQLGDGSYGILPEDWLRKYGVLTGLGMAHGDHLQFKRNQAGLLDALLLSQPQSYCDAVFERARLEMRSFEGVQPADPPLDFAGQLRGYQCEGLGWMNFLQKFGFGGCLADDMGLGKTVQVLALLESRRQRFLAGKQSKSEKSMIKGALPQIPENAGKPSQDTRHTSREVSKPSLVVVPRSLVFNWKQEAARFTPQLRILDHTGIERVRDPVHFENYDLVVTTYGTLRRDASHLKEIQFDYVILDEAQAIKNARTASAKAARLLNADHRLALSGTPVENHLGELWSLFEFLNPGMLGSSSVFMQGGLSARVPNEETRSLLARALRPFILRRTKTQVAKELPAKTEQTVYCELETAQRKLYDELRDHYRYSLLGRIAQQGLGKSKIQVLEALLRLRQCACHPGLIEKSRKNETSAKLDALLPQVIEVLEEGHKALVFSQFTSLLAIVRQRLDAEKICYLYLDGQTRDRQSLVEQFQYKPDPKLFLISLKAGGLGLNLTAAEYVFLLDPWWNPAVEAQAIDRTHRIGQSRQVFAYRIIARGTVEEKVLALQQTKRDLADAIIREDNSLIGSLTRDDLELLLS